VTRQGLNRRLSGGRSMDRQADPSPHHRRSAHSAKARPRAMQCLSPVPSFSR
jgi:hypothetical protein